MGPRDDEEIEDIAEDGDDFDNGVDDCLGDWNLEDL